MSDSAAAAAVSSILISLVFALALYVWTALALQAVFRKSGEQGWKAWVPFYNIATLLRLGGFSEWLVLLILVPGVGAAALFVLEVIACHRINRGFGFGAGMTVLAALLFPVWASVVGWGSSRWVGPVPGGARAVGPMRTGAPRPPAHAASAQAQAQALGWYQSSPGAAPTPIPPAPGFAPSGFAPAPGPAPQGLLPPRPPLPGAAAPGPVTSVPGREPVVIVPADTGLDDDSASMPRHRASFTEPGAEWADSAAPAASAASTPRAAPAASRRTVLGDAAPAAPRHAVSDADQGYLDEDGFDHDVEPPAAPVAPAAQANPWAPPAATRPPLRADEPYGFSDTSGEVSAVAGAPSLGAPMSARSSVSARREAPELPDAESAFDETIIAVRKRTPWVLVPPLGASVPITQDVLILGRRPSSDPTYPDAQLISIADETRTMSKTHARLELHDGTWVITDLDSTNGVVLIDVDGSEIEAVAGRPLPVIERFLLGDAELRLSRDGA
ncbi:hypothetical protein GCM10022240_28130 [Microbacterium kribbense]|uniref:FHA domain-containing protein n=1 Tax=Microbacterium kribbense TaxID=433645 RepID=A0ABP7GZB3_9MICO